ncbi:MAG: trehalose-phosphatase [archaeon]
MKVFLFLDYDGTLVSFKPRPEQAKPGKKLLRLIRKLCVKKNFVVSVVSGRTMKELKGFLPIKNLVFASSHGTQISFHSKKEFVFSGALKAVPVIKKIAFLSEKRFSSVKGLLLQDKKTAFVLHYRNVEKKLHVKLKTAFRKIVKETDTKKQLELISGAMVLEARPKHWNKGSAVKLILKEFKRKKNDSVFYFGDDLTDEDAFKALKKDFTFLVSQEKKKSNAVFRIKQDKVIPLLRLFLGFPNL